MKREVTIPDCPYAREEQLLLEAEEETTYGPKKLFEELIEVINNDD